MSGMQKKTLLTELVPLPSWEEKPCLWQSLLSQCCSHLQRTTPRTMAHMTQMIAAGSKRSTAPIPASPPYPHADTGAACYLKVSRLPWRMVRSKVRCTSRCQLEIWLQQEQQSFDSKSPAGSPQDERATGQEEEQGTETGKGCEDRECHGLRTCLWSLLNKAQSMGCLWEWKLSNNSFSVSEAGAASTAWRQRILQFSNNKLKSFNKEYFLQNKIRYN